MRLSIRAPTYLPLSRLFKEVEQGASLPKPWCQILMAAIPKGNQPGAYRLLGLAPVALKVWDAARHQQLRPWLAQRAPQGTIGGLPSKQVWHASPQLLKYAQRTSNLPLWFCRLTSTASLSPQLFDFCKTKAGHRAF